jgi:hypothetical protein
LGGFLFPARFPAFDVGDAALLFLGFVELLSHKSLHCFQNCFVCERTMKSWLRGFNPYLAFALLFLAAGCVSDKGSKVNYKKEVSTIRLYLEGNRAETANTGTVLVTRDKFPMTVEREPFLTEADLTKAMLIDDPGPDGSYSIQLAFNEHGSLLLDMMTTASKGRHIIIFSQFPIPGTKPGKEKKAHRKSDDDEQESLVAPPPESELAVPGKPRQSAWLAAVMIRSRNPTGIFRFTPDATHEEGARIVQGLKNVIAATKKKNKF